KGHGISHKWTKKLCSPEIDRPESGKGQRLPSHQTDQNIVFTNSFLQFFLKKMGIHQIQSSQSRARGFITVSGTDSAFGGSDFSLSPVDFSMFIQNFMIGHDKMSGFRNHQIFRSDLDSLSTQTANFLH